MSSFRRVLIVLASSIVALPSSEGAAQDLPPACSLLTTSEVNSAVGRQLESPREVNTVMHVGPSKGQTVRGCVWGADPSDVVLGVKAAEQGWRSAHRPEAYDAMRAQGWTVDLKTSENVICAATTAPATGKRAVFITTCVAEANGMGLSIMLPSTTKLVDIDAAKGLIDTAISRLP
jgi:hypothetical protein